MVYKQVVVAAAAVLHQPKHGRSFRDDSMLIIIHLSPICEKRNEKGTRNTEVRANINNPDNPVL